jgi:hypothetical protein
MKRKLLYSGSFLLVAGLSFTWTVKVRTQNPNHVAFTATVVEQRLIAGKEYEQENQLHAFRSDGSYVRILQRQTPNKEMVNVSWIVDANTGKSISIHPETETTMTSYLPKEQLDTQFRALNRSCSQGSSGEHRVIRGFDTVKTVQSIGAAPGDRSEIEEWKAPALDCFSLTQTLTQLAPDGTEHKTIRTATFVILGEPAGSLFEVPSGFTERSPSEAAAEFARRFPGRSVTDPGTLGRAESRYRSNQKPQ